MGAATADAQDAKLLGMRRGDAVLLVNTTALMENGEVLEYTASKYRADRYEYSTRHVFAAAAVNAVDLTHARRLALTAVTASAPGGTAAS